ncbi:conserved hypothetical protein [delta proteobacterium NaphS2]|nr:conserved hypothetical protein [delta proteobacterium NaphS2]
MRVSSYFYIKCEKQVKGKNGNKNQGQDSEQTEGRQLSRFPDLHRNVLT